MSGSGKGKGFRVWEGRGRGSRGRGRIEGEGGEGTEVRVRRLPIVQVRAATQAAFEKGKSSAKLQADRAMVSRARKEAAEAISSEMREEHRAVSETGMGRSGDSREARNGRNPTRRARPWGGSARCGG